MAFIPPLIAAAAAAASTAGAAIATTATAASAAVGGTTAALSLGSTVLSSVGALASGIAGQRAAEYNAKMADLQGKQAVEQAGLASSEAARRTRQVMAASRAGALENGVELSGSTADLLNQASRQGYLDQLTAVYSGQVGQANAASTAKLDRMQGGYALLGGVVGAGSKAISGGADYYRIRSGKSSLDI